MSNGTMWDRNESDMSKEMDEKIREELIRTAAPLPGSYEQRVYDVLQHLPEKKKRWRTFPKVASVAAVVGVLVVSTGVVAGVKLYQKRLASMKSEQVEELYSVIQEQQIDADVYSREMSETEEAKYRELMEKYEKEGLFPKKEMLCVKTEQDVVPGVLCYCYENGTFYLPEQELSEEELLQLVDFKYKVNYSLEKGLDKENGDELGDTEEKVADVSGTEEGDLALEKGKKLFEDLYGWDMGGAACQVEKDEDGDFSVKIEKEDWQYEVEVGFLKETIEFSGMKLKDKNLDDTKPVKLEGLEIDEEEYRSYGEQVWKMVKKIEPREEMENLSFSYYRCKDGTVLFGKATYYITCKDGNGFIIEYSGSKGVVYDIMDVKDVSEWIKTLTNVADYEIIWKKIR